MRQIAEKPLAQYPLQVGEIWRSRNIEPGQEVFDGLPDWMDRDPQDHCAQMDMQRLIAEALEALTEREVRVLRLRFWEDLTLEEVAVKLEVTRERVRQIEGKAIRKLRHPSVRNKLIPYSLWSGWFRVFARGKFKTLTERTAALWNVQKRIEYPIGLWGYCLQAEI